ncbi:hypothetical protein, partial [Microcoleus sp.]|uniref:hypothetical protein n=1 Tax=Microcoleus sp. TaxID=44472 RepID=UPI00403E5508
VSLGLAQSLAAGCLERLQKNDPDITLFSNTFNQRQQFQFATWVEPIGVKLRIGQNGENRVYSVKTEERHGQ